MQSKIIDLSRPAPKPEKEEPSLGIQVLTLMPFGILFGWMVLNALIY